MKERIGKLISVKSIVTLLLTGVFCYLAIKGEVPETFKLVYITIIGFYFGTQATKEGR